MTINQNEKKIDRIIIILFSLYPIAILSGNLIINSFVLIIGTIFFVRFLKKDFYFFQYKDIFYLLGFFFISLIINLFFSYNIYLSYQRVLKIFFIIFFVVAFKFLIINHYNNIKTIYKFWCIIFLIVLIDLLVELNTGKNMLGQSSIMPGRLASFTGEESVIGNYFFGFSLIFLSCLYNFSKKIIFNLFVLVFLIIISFYIGERSNFIKTFICIILFLFFAYKVNYKYKIFALILMSILSVLIFFNLENLLGKKKYDAYEIRYLSQIKSLSSQGLTKYLEDTQYGAHRNVAKEIFLDNFYFGVGVKNFRNESANKKYDKLDHKQNHLRVSNHPHELYYEILSETGTFGLFSFLIFILFSIFLSLKNYLKFKNIYQLSSIIFVLVSIVPVLPAGSFLSTYASSIFWINYAIMMGYNKSIIK